MLLLRRSFLHTIGSKTDIHAAGHASADGRFRLFAVARNDDYAAALRRSFVRFSPDP